VKEKLDNHFIVRRNVIFERAKFNKRKQEDSENVENFVIYCINTSFIPLPHVQSKAEQGNKLTFLSNSFKRSEHFFRRITLHPSGINSWIPLLREYDTVTRTDNYLAEYPMLFSWHFRNCAWRNISFSHSMGYSAR
jgi:hypothetical protein